MTTGINTPFGINLLGSLLSNTGLTINPIFSDFIGTSKTNSNYQPGTLVSGTILRYITHAIQDGYTRGPGNGNATLTNPTYTNLINIGSSSIPALGNSKPPAYAINDPTAIWQGQATTGYASTGTTNQSQGATWLPYDLTNTNKSVTQWGYLRLHALQAWNEMNWYSDDATASSPSYSALCSSLQSVDGFISRSNKTILAAQNAKTFMDGAYSNMNDLLTSDVSGVSLSLYQFGTDLENLGNAISFHDLDSFGLPSNLLRILHRHKAIIEDLGYALIAMGIDPSLFDKITNDTSYACDKDTERNILEAFSLVIGENLSEITAMLKCTTRGLESLTDLINIKKMFPLSYSTLTVPYYNSVAGPTNSKTYYLLYTNSGINPALSTEAMRDYVGVLTPNNVGDVTPVSELPDTVAPLREGFDSYLYDILPADQAVAAGAFSFTMRQINNIQSVDHRTFAKVAKSLEISTNIGNDSGISSLPVSPVAANNVIDKLALGSGPYGTYTYSDFFGCMSGLPYPSHLVNERIKQLESVKLHNVYHELYLATTWRQATANVTYTTYQGGIGGTTTYYHVTGFQITDAGGGYGRGTAPVPTITVTGGSGATGTVVIGNDSFNIGTSGQFGRVINIELTSSGTDTTSLPTVTIQAPPTDSLSIAGNGDYSTSGTNTANGTNGWAVLNPVIQAYIDQANAEITAINAAKPVEASYLNTYWNMMGNQLMIEQRSRYKALLPVPIPLTPQTDHPYPMTLESFIDDVSSMAENTLPHMAAQTLEAISDLDSDGGKNLITMTRAARNATRLQSIGIEPDSEIPDILDEFEIKSLMANGTLPGAIEGTGVAGCGIEYTKPAYPQNKIGPNRVHPVPNASYSIPAPYQPTRLTTDGKYVPISGRVNIGNGLVYGTGTTQGDITPIIECSLNPAVSTMIVSGITEPIALPTGIVTVPSELDPDNLPPTLNVDFTASVLISPTPDPVTAVNEVIEGNCDCWI